MKVTTLLNGRTVKITSKGVYFKLFGQWDKYPVLCETKLEFCGENADNVYWKEAILCKKHYQATKELMPTRLQ